MAKILYGICGEGLGHASRCRILINHLKNNHDVRIVAGGKAYKFLSKEFESVEEIESPRLIYEGGDVRLFHSIISMLYKSISRTPLSFLKIRKIIKNFKPDICITDAEPISHLAARFSKIKRISIDNPQALVYRKYQVTAKEIIPWFVLIIALKLAMFGANKYIIYDFFDKRAKDPRVLFLKPLIQEGILKQKPKTGNHIFVYQTSASTEFIFDIFKKTNERFVIYGFNKELVDKNLVFRQFNEIDFYNDISNAKAVITNGGFSVLSEALYLKKPIFSMPIKNQFEQVFNAKIIEKLGVGVHHNELTEDNLKAFIKNLNFYMENLKSYIPGNQDKTLEIIEKEIQKVLNN
jgi:uncharacterized protein (TIGR00661 family)